MIQDQYEARYLVGCVDLNCDLVLWLQERAGQLNWCDLHLKMTIQDLSPVSSHYLHSKIGQNSYLFLKYFSESFDVFLYRYISLTNPNPPNISVHTLPLVDKFIACLQTQYHCSFRLLFSILQQLVKLYFKTQHKLVIRGLGEQDN